MATTCLNCGTALSDNYCPHCGQKATVGRLTWHHIGEEIVHFFTHIEHGFLGTTKDLIIRPAIVQKNFLDGKRKNYHKPVSFLLIWVAIFLVVSALTTKFGNFEKEFARTLLTDTPELEAVIYKYQAFVEIFILPFTAFNSWLLMGYPRLTYLEILITGFYRFSVFYMLATTNYLVAAVIGFNPESEVSLYVFTVIFTGWSIYVLFSFFKLYKVKYLIFRVIATIAIAMLMYPYIRMMIGKMLLAGNL